MKVRSRIAFWLAALVTSALWLAAWHATPVHEPDSAGYLEVAADLADGSLDRVWGRTPGYPLLLLATGSWPDPMARLVMVQLALHALSAAALLSLLRRLGITPGVRAVVAAIALSPPFVEHAAYVLTESLVQVLVIPALVGLLRFVLDGTARWLAVGALGLATAGLVHPAWAPSVLALAIVVAIASRLPALPAGSARRGVVAALAVLLAGILVLGSFVTFQSARFGFAGLAPTLGSSLSHKTGRVLEAIPDAQAAEREILIRHRNAALVDPRGDHQAHSYIYRAIPELEAATGLSGPALDAHIAAIQARLIARHPMEYLDEVLRSWLWYWSPGVSPPGGLGIGPLRFAGNAMRAALNGLFALALVLALGPLWIDARRRQRGRAEGSGGRARRDELVLALALLLGAVVVSGALSSALTAAVWRLRVPVDLAILGAIPLLFALRASLERALGGTPPVVEVG